MTDINIIQGKCDECERESILAEFGGMKIVTEGNSVPIYICKHCITEAIKKMANYE